MRGKYAEKRKKQIQEVVSEVLTEQSIKSQRVAGESASGPPRSSVNRQRRGLGNGITALLVAVLLAFAPFGYTNLGFGNSQEIGIVSWLLCLFVIGLTVWLFTEIWEQRTWTRLLPSIAAPAIMAVLLAGPVWRKLNETQVRISFKASPLLTRRVQWRIRRDVTKCKQYLMSVDIEVPDELPPFEVDTSDNSMGSSTPANLPIYRGNFAVGYKVVGDRMMVTRSYISYVFDWQINRHASELFPSVKTNKELVPFVSKLMFMQSIVTSYFNSRFWNRRTKDDDPWAEPLWNIRNRFGQDFTDKLVAYTAKGYIDTPWEGAEPEDIYGIAYFRRKMKIADSVIDGENRWPEIQKILWKPDLTKGPNAYR